MNKLEILWKTCIPIKIKLDHIEELNEIPSKPYYLMVNRLHYISLYFDEIHKHFSHFIFALFNTSDIWLEWKNQPVNCEIPFGVFFDILANEEEDLPIEMILHYRFFPKEALENCKKRNFSEKDLYFFDLKQASCIKFENNAHQIICKLPVEQQDLLWEHFVKGDFAKFYTLFTPIYSSFCLPPKKPPAVLPIRIFFAKRPLLKIQRGIPLEENQMGDRLNVPLNVQLKVLFPDFKEKELTVKIFGAELDEKIGLRDLYEDWCYLDGFVYLVVGRRDGGGR